MIHTSLSPNTESDDLWLALKQLALPWNWFNWKKGKAIKQLEKQFSDVVQIPHAISFQRGRDALTTLLKAIGIRDGDEVVLQAYTCIVVPNAIQFTGAKPVYVDIEKEGFNIDPEAIEKAITDKTKAVIIQHTFGEAADLPAIQALCKKHKILLIEDCAHSLSGTYESKPLGSFGDAAIFSFGRDKILSSVWGGMATTKHDELAKRLRYHHKKLRRPGLIQIKQALLHPLVFAAIKPIYHSKIGKGLLVLSQKIRMIPRVIFPEEKQGKQLKSFPQQMANAMAVSALHQLKKMTRFQRQRQNIASLYASSLEGIPGLVLIESKEEAHPAWLRYTIRHAKAASLLKKAQKKGIYLGNWYTTVLAPGDCALEKFQYSPGSCPRAEKAALETLNLPTHIQMTAEQVQEVVGFIQKELGR
jgi:perosamine synthetase